MLGDPIKNAQQFLKDNKIDGWLVYDYLNSNPVFNKLLSSHGKITRPVFFLITPTDLPYLITHHVDLGRFNEKHVHPLPYNNRKEMLAHLRDVLINTNRVAMEYSPFNQLPRISRVDAGTVELIQSLNTTVISSADLVQYATQTLDETQIESHLQAGQKLGKIVHQAFEMIGANLNKEISEFDVAEYIRELFSKNDLTTYDGPVVAINENSADPHYEPLEKAKTFKKGDWILIDLWAKNNKPNSIYSDITWVAHIGNEVPLRHKEVFDIVTEARDKSLHFLEQRFASQQPIEGWEVDQIARTIINNYGYGEYFTHRLGHGIGEEVHSEGVNLDSWETHDTRSIMIGSTFSIEPGIYLPGNFGVRSEIDVHVGIKGPYASSPVQTDIVLINPNS